MSNDLRSWFVTFPNGMASSSSAPYIYIDDSEDEEPVVPAPPSSPAPPIPSPPPSERDDSDPEEDPEEDPDEDPEEDPEEDPDEDPDEDPVEEPAEGTQEIPAEGPSTHPPPVLDVPEPKRQRTDAEEIAKLREDLYWANDRIEYNVRELWDANERQDNLAHLVNDILEALEDLVVSENEEENEEDEEEEGEEPAPAVDSDPESTVEDD
ncbi:hypothetical protein E3N88_04248 [Mikania micrantha]|uniref:Uncharacterized protein n=1 Tax=Mikania micrantha TaxID=192012 RepID=A0A5N6PW22_9ASTR|nr:hypothetical protein E3N88_04246 [Mikania micrantha]KAD7116980.1 hypothetical protein E3N88_04248 [Mikania micrantha]